jgi:membrane protein involved in colicin uptake
MDILNYYIKTLSAAGGKLLPVGVFLLVGYFLFIKLPFYFMVKVNKENKPKAGDQELKKVPTLDEKIKLEQNNYQERLNQAREEKEKNQKQQKKKPEEPKKAPQKNTSAEEVFEIRAGEILTKSELKKRYFELLKMNHPDKVASLGSDFKILAEKKTKAINSAYEELKKKAS